MNLNKCRGFNVKLFFALFATLLICFQSIGQIIITNFTGLNLSDTDLLGTGVTPPDTMGAAGTNQFVEFINGAFAIYDKPGVRQLMISDSNFWANAGISPVALSAGVFDPRITFDAGSGRWIATELTGQATGNSVLLARSDSSDPGGRWQALVFLGSTGFADFDTLGVDALGVYICVNVYDAANYLTGVSIFSIPKADILAGAPTLTNMSKFENLSADIYGFALQGVNNPDAGAGRGVILGTDYLFYNLIDRTTINGPGAAGATLSTTAYISSAYDTNPNPSSQPAGQAVDAASNRFSGAVRQIGGYIFMANTILNTNNNRDAGHWIVMNETKNTVTSEGIITDPDYDFTYASIAASHSGKVLLGFNRAGTNDPAGDISIYAALGTMVNGVVTMGLPFLLKQGTVNNFAISFDTTPYRWGDYSATMFDPTDENLVWTIQEIPISSAAWGTEVSLISMVTNRPFLNLILKGNTATISWPLSADPAYTLQSTTFLPNSTWTTLPAASLVSINQRVITVPIAGPAHFFRLMK